MKKLTEVARIATHVFRRRPEHHKATESTEFDCSPRISNRPAFNAATALLIAASISGARGELPTITLEYNNGRPYLSPITTLPRTGVLIPYYDEDGFLTKPLGLIDTQAPYRVAIYGPGTYPDNQTAFIKLAYGSSYEVFGQNDEVFDAISIDLGEYSIVYPVPRTIHFIGTKADGSLVRTSFTTDGKIGPGAPGGGFETFYFPDSFQDIVNLRAATELFSLDNLKLSVVPDPPVIVEGVAIRTAHWTPKRRMMPVTFDVQVEAGEGESTWRVVGIECSEECPTSDMHIVDDHTVLLRANSFKRRQERVYTIWLQATDEAGVSSVWYPVDVTVQHKELQRRH